MNISVLTSGKDPANTLQIIVMENDSVLFQGSFTELGDELASAQNTLTTKQAVSDAVSALFTFAGITDLSAPLNQKQIEAFDQAVNQARKVTIQNKIDDLTAERDQIDVAIASAVTADITK